MAIPVIDNSFQNTVIRGCTPASRQPDPETSCGPFCGDSQKMEFDACKQSFYLEQQNEVLRQISEKKPFTTSTGGEQRVTDLESHNADLQKIIDRQGQQITQLVQGAAQADNKIENLYIVNTSLVALLVIACIFFVVRSIKRNVSNNGK